MQQQNRNSKNKELCKFVQITDMYNVVIQWNLCYMSWFVALFVSDDTTLKPHSLYQWKPPSAGAGLITNWPSTLNVLPACDDWAGRGVDIRQCLSCKDSFICQFKATVWLCKTTVPWDYSILETWAELCLKHCILTLFPLIDCQTHTLFIRNEWHIWTSSYCSNWSQNIWHADAAITRCHHRLCGGDQRMKLRYWGPAQLRH